MQYGSMMVFGTVQYGMMYHGMLRMVRYTMGWITGTTWWHVGAIVWCGTVEYSMVWHFIVWYGLSEYDMVWCGRVQQYGMIQYGMAWYDTV